MTMSNRIAVMRHGKIEQLGSPEELYERPTTEFVAGFLGVSNLLDAEVLGKGERFADLRLVDGTVVRAPSSSLNGASRVRIGIRPEKLRVLAAGDGASSASSDANALEGTVLDASYIGVSTQYLIETGDGNKMVVYAQNLETSGASEVHPDGERVQLTWHPQHTFVIPAAAATDPTSTEGETDE